MDTATLLTRAAQGDQPAWRALVDRYSPLVWRVARAHRLSTTDAADVSQSTWIALADNISTVHSPDRLAGWLATTARRESLKLLRGREIATDTWGDWADPADDPEQTTLRTERDDLLWRAFSALRVRCRQLLGLQAYAPELSYAELAAAVGLANSAVAKTRGRCLAALRRELAGLGLRVEEAG
ncbi:RNA polymerase sigma factor [Actinokineospora sp. G85]|uniref:RNA polymerase sigma factor n=1 Tax=Actinokineospora sp. G85 TaxID=3406626 RepID=UPI003C7545C9